MGRTRLIRLAAIGMALALGAPLATAEAATISPRSNGYSISCDALPAAATGPIALGSYPATADGIPISRVRGRVVNYHPLESARIVSGLVATYRDTSDAQVLATAMRVEANMWSHAVLSQRAAWLPYEFPFALHGLKKNRLKPPWYSGMAQGIAISAELDLYHATNDSGYLIKARLLYNALTLAYPVRSIPKTGRYVTFVDASNFLWFEEYAGRIKPARVINGHMFAMMGILDYYCQTGDPQAAQLLNYGATTMLAYWRVVRVPGKPSWYGVRIRNVKRAQSAIYHVIVTRQFRTLAVMTGDPAFDRVADVFYADYH